MKGPSCRLERVNRREDQIKLFPVKAEGSYTVDHPVLLAEGQVTAVRPWSAGVGRSGEARPLD